MNLSKNPRSSEKMSLEAAANPIPTDNDSEYGISKPLPENDPESGISKPLPANGALKSVFKELGIIDRFLFFIVLLAMIIGIILGNFVPNTGPALQRGELVGVSGPVAAGLILMIYPILCGIEYESLHHLFNEKGIWKQIGFSMVVNWLYGPFLMLALAWACLPDKPELREGVILVGIARCIAMCLMWNRLAKGNGMYAAILVSINSILQIILYAPFSIFFVKVISRSSETYQFSYSTSAKSVAVFLGIPLAGGLLTRFGLSRLVGKNWYNTVFMKWMNLLSVLCLLFVVIILFASQGAHVVRQIVSVVRVAVPMTIYFFAMFYSILFLTYKLHFSYDMAVAQSFIAASNNFELAIAVTVTIFGHDSNQALAATVGPLTEVPILLIFVYVARYIGIKTGWAK